MPYGYQTSDIIYSLSTRFGGIQGLGGGGWNNRMQFPNRTVLNFSEKIFTGPLFFRKR